MIKSFGDKSTESIFNGLSTKDTRKLPSSLLKVIHRKLDMLNAAAGLIDLRVPPGNRLEALKGGWQGYFSIRVNDQFRVVFRWNEGASEDVRVLDYH